VRIGDNKGAPFASDNFWQMADTGPCGPCSEIFYDHGPEIWGGPPGSPEEDGDRYIEIWNNVFMQFDRQIDPVTGQATLTPLPAPCVDTGMGLERLAAILQHVHSNYEIDLFQRLIAAAARETGCKDPNHSSLRVIADHIRACAFLITDGVVPGSDGRAYVLRRIVRRALRHGNKLGQKQPFFFKLIPDLVAEMGTAYPELAEAADRVAKVLRQEEERFGETLENGMKILEAALAKDPMRLDGKTAFALYDTYGFPLDLTADICRERDVILDEAGFHEAMEKQKSAARAAGKFEMATGLDYAGPKTAFNGYDHLVSESTVLAIFVGGQPVKEASATQEAVVILDHTPFYAESGGQAGDVGVIEAGNAIFEVRDTQKIQPEVFGHHGVMSGGRLAVGDKVNARVNAMVRAATMRNHSATHLMHKALRTVLGGHVVQKGSLVDADKTRFDFSHSAPLTADEIRRIEALVNHEILDNAATSAQLMAYDDAIRHGAMALFGEKYGDRVRVLGIGSSTELCGGTHVDRTGDIGLFKIVSEGGVAAGIRRVEAVTGEKALALVQSLSARVTEVAAALKVQPDEITQRISQVQEQVRSLEKELASLKARLASGQGDDLLSQAVDMHGIKVLAATLDGADAATMRQVMDKMKHKLKSAAIVLASVADGKVTLIAGVTADATSKVKAGELVNFVAQQVGGKGGGRADMAQAGGTDPSALPAALAAVSTWVGERVG
jgi:alanyl-tRNA synthetase